MKKETIPKNKKPYSDLTDLEKLTKQWWKLSGLHNRAEWSAAVVRAATAAEITANIAIRKEFAEASSLDEKFIDSLLIWANGLKGKIDRLLNPIVASSLEDRINEIKRLSKFAIEVNDIRNQVVHKGMFCNEQEAKDTIEKAKNFIEGILAIYEPEFQLTEQSQEPED
jgi:hypothetical protein